MNKEAVFKCIMQRHSKREYLDKPLENKKISQALEIARHAASSKNTQPWQVTIVSANKKDHLAKTLCELFDQGKFESPDYNYSPQPLPEKYLQRARECGYGLFQLKGIKREDKEARRASDRLNFSFFGAPHVAFFFLDSDSQYGTFLDLGLYLQNFMLALVAQGISSCPQYSLTSFSKTIKKELNISTDKILVCGLSFGIAKPDSKINSYIPERINIDEFCDWQN